MATTNPRIPMIMSKFEPLLFFRIFFSSIGFLFKDYFNFRLVSVSAIQRYASNFIIPGVTIMMFIGAISVIEFGLLDFREFRQAPLQSALQTLQAESIESIHPD
jgi:hypothetical protein